MTRSHRLLAACVVALASTAASAKVVWRGNFESGDISQWNKAQKVSANRLEVVTDPVAEGFFALKTTVRKGDDPINASGHRNELVSWGHDKKGSERFYRWQTMWPEDYESPDTWQLFTQWHHDGKDGSPPVEFYTRGEEIILRVSGDELWRAPLERGRWHDFVFHVKWDRSGFVELFHNGVQVLEKTTAPTLYAGQGVYLKQGLYRDASISQTQTIYHDGMVIGTTLAAVMEPSPEEQARQGSRSGAKKAAEADGVDFNDPNLWVEGPDGELISVYEATGCSTTGRGRVPLAGLLLVGGVMAAGVARRRRAEG